MSTDTTSFLAKSQTNTLKLVLTKDARVTLASSSTVPAPIFKTVIKEAPPQPKQDMDSFLDKPIVVPTVPKLISAIRNQPTLAQFFPAKSIPLPVTKTQPSSSAPTQRQLPNTTPTQRQLPSTTPTQRQLPSTMPTQRQQPSATLKQTQLPPSQKHKIDDLLKNRTVVKQKEPVATVGSSCQSDLHPPKPKKVKSASSTNLPHSRVKTIMKTNVQSNQTTVSPGQESVALFSKAAEMFIAELAKRSLETATKEQGSVKCLTYTHLAETVQKSKDLHFLHAVIPKKVLARDVLTSYSNDSTGTTDSRLRNTLEV